MLTRRTFIALAGAAGAAGTARDPGYAASQATVHTPVNFDVPKGACDCHVHVIPDPAQFPFWSGRGYTPPVDTAEDLLNLQNALHLDRVVIVTPSVYGTDNSATLDGIKKLGQRARGVAVIGPSASAAELDAMYKAGIRGIRVNLEQGGVTDPAVAGGLLDSAVARIKGSPLHLQIYARLTLVEALKGKFAEVPMPVVFDHFAGAQAAAGVDQPGFGAVLDLVRAGKAYVKISGAYRASEKAPDYPDTAPLARALLQANPDRIVWGTDWPHPDSYKRAGRAPTDLAPALPIDDGRLLNLLAEWAPDPALRRKVLVENPARLYGYPAA
jgi:predicted TIM-barrel fold metal-dependent hydrolase